MALPLAAGALGIQGLTGIGQIIGGLGRKKRDKKLRDEANRAFEASQRERKSQAAQTASLLRGQGQQMQQAFRDPSVANQFKQTARDSLRTALAATNRAGNLGTGARAAFAANAAVQAMQPLNQIGTLRQQQNLQGLQALNQGRLQGRQVETQAANENALALANRTQALSDRSSAETNALIGAGMGTLQNLGSNLLTAAGNNPTGQNLLGNLFGGRGGKKGQSNLSIAKSDDLGIPGSMKPQFPSPGFQSFDPRSIRGRGFQEGGMVEEEEYEEEEYEEEGMDGGMVQGETMGDNHVVVTEAGEYVLSNADKEYILEASTDEERGRRFMEVANKYEREAEMEDIRQERSPEGQDTVTEIVQVATQLGSPPSEEEIGMLQSLEQQELDAILAELQTQVAGAGQQMAAQEMSPEEMAMMEQGAQMRQIGTPVA